MEKQPQRRQTSTEAFWTHRQVEPDKKKKRLAQYKHTHTVYKPHTHLQLTMPGRDNGLGKVGYNVER